MDSFDCDPTKSTTHGWFILEGITVLTVQVSFSNLCLNHAMATLPHSPSVSLPTRPSMAQWMANHGLLRRALGIVFRISLYSTTLIFPKSTKKSRALSPGKNSITSARNQQLSNRPATISPTLPFEYGVEFSASAHWWNSAKNLFICSLLSSSNNWM